MNILIVDDDIGDRRLVRRLVRQSGLPWECLEAASLQEALALCDGQRIDCTVLDYRLPDCDGLQSLSALRRRDPHMPVVMMTGQGDEVIAAEVMKTGASDYLPKSQLTDALLQRTIENAVEKARLAQNLARQRDELQNFAVVLAHDLKAPTMAMLAFARFAESELRKEDVDNRRLGEYCSKIALGAKQMAALIDTLFAYTRVDTEVSFAPVALRSVMDSVVANLSTVMEQRQAVIDVGDLPEVQGNKALLIQLLQNLAGNAIKYCTRTPALYVTAERRAGAWEISMRDNGIGIPEKEQHAVFGLFHRAHRSERYEGLGLGLATCKKIVERHGGTIRCESEVGVGTTFSFTLPAVA